MKTFRCFTDGPNQLRERLRACRPCAVVKCAKRCQGQFPGIGHLNPQHDDFYRAEWEELIAAHGVQTRDDYRRISRIGRKGALSRSRRDQIWPVFEEYRAQLSTRRLKDVDDAYRDAAQLLANEPESLYSAVVVDETQDFGPQALRLIRAMVPAGPNDLFFVGDGH